MPATIDDTPTSPLPASAMPLISPNALLYAHLNQDPPTRPSQRTPSEARDIELNIGSLTHCNGSSLVKIGSTTIVCGVRAELLPVSEIPSFRITKSSSTTPSSGRRQGTGEDLDEADYSAIPLYHLLVPNLELATGCSPNHLANTPPSVEAQSISQRLLSLLHTSKLVRTSDLQIWYTPPTADADAIDLGIDTDPQLKAYWVLYIDMMCISYGGSISDAAWLALYAALRDTIIPKAWWDADLAQITCSPRTSEARRLDLRRMPVPSTFVAFVPEKRVVNVKAESPPFTVLADPDMFEEECCEETCCITIDLNEGESPKILRIEKNGGTMIGTEEIRKMLPIAQKRWNMWKNVLDGALRKS